jgi:hypothetical protein
METNLRPLSLGEILDRTAQLYRTNFVLFAGISAVYAGVLLVLNLVQLGLTALLTSLHMTQQLPWFLIGWALLILPLIFICTGAAMAANNRAVAWVNMGQPATIRSAYMSILPRLGRYLWLMTIAAFICYLPLALILLIYLVFMVAYAGSKGLLTHAVAGGDPQAAIVIAVATVVFFVLSLPALIYAVWMALRYSLAIPASVVEDLKARKALRRSVELTQGSRGRIFVLGLLIAVIQTGLVLVTQLFFIIAAVKQRGVLPMWAQVAQQIVGFLTNSFIGPMYATGLTLFYYDQRIRKEGFDIEWMMQAAGLTPPSPEQVHAQSAAPEGAGFAPDPDRQELRVVLAPEESAPEVSISPESLTEPGPPPAPPAPDIQHE